MAAAREQFRRVAERYAKSRAHADKRFLARIVSLVRPRRGERILDLATGPGFVGVEFAKKGLEVVGTDITTEMLRQARQLGRRSQAGIHLVLADAAHQPFPDKTFDIVVSRLALHHLKSPVTVVESMTALVRPGGKIVVADLVVSEDDEIAEFHNRLERFRDPSHERSLKLSEWKSIFHSNGLPLKAIAQSKITLQLEEWADRAGFAQSRDPELAEMLEKAPAKVKKALSVVHRNGLLFFKNTRAIVVGVKE